MPSAPIATPAPIADTPRPDPTNRRLGMSIQTNAAEQIQSESQNDSHRFAMGVLFLLAAAFHCIFGLLGPLANPSFAIHPDTAVYESLGIHALQHRSFAWPKPPETGIDADLHSVRTALNQPGATAAETLRMPGYALLLGLQNAAGLPGWSILVLQILLAAAAAPVAFFAGTQIAPNARVGAWAAGLLVALHPAAIASSGALLPATIFVFLMTAAVALAVQNSCKRADAPLIGGLCLGLSSLMLPVNWLVLGAIPLLAWAKQPSFQGVKQAALFAALAIAIPLTWSYRNHLHQAGFTPSTAWTVAAYYEPALGASPSTNPANATPDALRQALTAKWFQETDAKQSDNAVEAMKALVQDRQASLRVGDRIRSFSVAVFQRFTAENAATAFKQLGLSTAPETVPAQGSRNLLTLSSSNATTASDIKHVGTAWILINGVLMMIGFIGSVFFAFRGQPAMAVATGVIALGLAFLPQAPSGDPYGLVLLGVQPLLVASALTPPAKRVRRRRKRKKLEQHDPAPRFNVYGQPIIEKPVAPAAPAFAPVAATAGVDTKASPAKPAKPAFAFAPAPTPAPAPDASEQAPEVTEISTMPAPALGRPL